MDTSKRDGTNQENILTIDTTLGTSTPKKVELLDIFTDKHPLMRMIIPEFKESIPNPALDDLIDRMILTRQKVQGLGLAANQCGLPIRAFVIGTDTFDMICINPEILETGGQQLKAKEGCLSFPGLLLNIRRPDEIKVRYTDRTGEVVEKTLVGLTARCFQHEMDHLNGVVFTDHVGSMSMLMAKKKKKKLIKQLEKREMYRG